MRRAGVLLPVTALPAPWGVGTLGAEARRFVDFLAAAGQSVWQMLPLGPTGYGDSPYASFSAFAGNPYLIDLDDLVERGLLTTDAFAELNWGADPTRVDYGLLYQQRMDVLRQAARTLLAKPPYAYAAFEREQAAWLDDYAFFMAQKNARGGAPWWEWPEALAWRDEAALAAEKTRLADEIACYKAVQYLFFAQWDALHVYAAEHGIDFLGDLPIYVAQDSADVWAHPEQFQLDEKLAPTEVAGCPPDGFSATGQLWGNPLYNWELMEAEGFSWWIQRIQAQLSRFDAVRIDHFRGFESYCAIPAGDADACRGRWRKGPGIRLFKAIEAALGPAAIVAEDLGFITPEVRSLLKESGYPGMSVLLMAFDGRDPAGNAYLPHNIKVNSVAYVGTHDNPPAAAWLAEVDAQEVANATAYLGLNSQEGLVWGLMRGIWASPAELAIVQAQDLLGLGAEARINTPSTSQGNWAWRLTPGQLDDALAKRLAAAMQVFCRAPADAPAGAAAPDVAASDAGASEAPVAPSPQATA